MMRVCGLHFQTDLACLTYMYMYLCALLTLFLKDIGANNVSNVL